LTVATGFDFARGLDCAVGGRSGDLAHPNGIHQCADRAFIRSEHHPKCLSHSPLACDHTCRLASCWRPAQNRDRRHHQIHIALAVSQCPTARDPWRFLNAGQLSARVFRYCRRVAFGRWLIQKRQKCACSSPDRKSAALLRADDPPGRQASDRQSGAAERHGLGDQPQDALDRG